MASVLSPQSANWIENLTQLDTTDPVLGGSSGIANQQAKEFDSRTRYLKAEVETKADSADFNDLDLSIIGRAFKSQSVTVASGDTNKSIDLALGAKVYVTLNNTSTCTLAFTGLLKDLPGIIVFTASGADRTITLPTTWQPSEDTRTLTIKSGQKRTLPFEVVSLAENPAEVIIAGVLGYRHLP